MSCRQPPSARRSRAAPEAAETRAALLIVHLDDIVRMKAFEKLRGLHAVEFRVARLDAEEKTVVGGEAEPRHIENRMMRLRQLVQREHAQDGKESRAEDGALKRDRDERRPAIEG